MLQIWKSIRKIQKTNTFNDDCLLDRQTSFDVLKREYLEHNVLESNVEEKIFELLSKNDFKQICYYYDSEEKIVKKLCSLRKSYYYIRPKFDNLGEDYKFGDRYNDCISKFKIMDTLVNKKRFIVDKYNCELKKITFEINEVPDDIIKDIIKQYKKGRNYYVKDSYGLELKCSRKEIIDYCKRKYLFCVLSFDIAIDFDKTKGYEFVYKKECDNENKNSWLIFCFNMSWFICAIQISYYMNELFNNFNILTFLLYYFLWYHLFGDDKW